MKNNTAILKGIHIILNKNFIILKNKVKVKFDNIKLSNFISFDVNDLNNFKWSLLSLLLNIF